MEPIKIERKEEITIEWTDIRGAVEDIYYDYGVQIEYIPSKDYIINTILKIASVTELDDDLLSVWRDQIDEQLYNKLIEKFWDEYKAYGCEKTIKAIEDRVKEKGMK